MVENKDRFGGLTFEQFSKANKERCTAPNGFNHDLNAWSDSDWMTAIMGELGEAANIVKKLNRSRDGITGNNLDDNVLRAKLQDELGDTFIYLDLYCLKLGISIGRVAAVAFNKKSMEIGCDIFIDY